MKSQDFVTFHIINSIPLHENAFRYGSDAYFETFRQARQQLREGKLENIHWFDREILENTDLGEWVTLKGGIRVPLDMPISEDVMNHHLRQLIESRESGYSSEDIYTIENPDLERDAETGREEPDEIEVYVEWGSPSGDFEIDKVVRLDTGEDITEKIQGQSYYNLAHDIKQRVEQQRSRGEYLEEAEYQGKKVELNKPKRGGSKKFYVYTRNPKTKKIIKVSFGAQGGGGSLAVKLKDPKARANFAKRHNCASKNDKTKAGYWACRLPRYAKSLGLSGGGQWW